MTRHAYSDGARLQDLTHQQIGALLCAARAPLRLQANARWLAFDGSRIERATVNRLLHLHLLEASARGGRGPHTQAILTEAGETLATTAIAISAAIATAIAERPDSSPGRVADFALAQHGAAVRLSTRRTPREVIAAQLGQTGKVIA